MVAREAYRAAVQTLTAAGIEDAAYDAAQLLEMATGMALPAFGGADLLSETDAQHFASLVQKRAAHYPLQYLAGAWGFYTITLKIGEGVLIPRADTETVVEQALQLLCTPKPVVYDLCAGSGAIGCAIRHERPDADVTCVELSTAALTYLRENAKTYGVTTIAADVCGFERTLAANSADLIVSNPPYVTAQEYKTLAPELYFEPEMALVAPQDGLAFYAYIAAHYRFALKPGGILCVEIGSGQKNAVQEILNRNGYTEIGAVCDLAGLDRCVFGTKES